MKNSEIEKIVFSTTEASQYTGLAESTLRRGRLEGYRDGRCATPPFIRMGRAIRYLKGDLDNFLSQHRVVSRIGDSK